MHGLYLLWWVQEKQISPAIVATMLAVGDLALMGVEVPTGWFADRFGHRASLIIGSLVQVAGMFWCWLGEGIPGLIIATVLVALGDGFRSGADQALLYRTCVALDQEDRFQRIEARTRAAELVALVALVLTGGVITSAWGFEAGWAAETTLCALGVALACAMSEPPANGAPHLVDSTGQSAGPKGPALQALHSAGPKGPTLRAERPTAVVTMMTGLIVPAAVLGGIASIASFMAQTTGRSGPDEVAVLVAALTLAEATGSMLAVRMPRSRGRSQVALAATGVLLVAAALVVPSMFLAVTVLLQFLVGLAQPLRAAAIQRLAADGVRARAASLANACDMAASTIMLPLAGVWQSRRRV
jgi:hypothetical protein